MTPSTQDRLKDAMIAAKFFGWTMPEGRRRLHSPACLRDEENCNGEVPHYSTDPAASKQLRQRLAETYDWMLGSGKTRRNEPQYGFALYVKGSKGHKEVATGEADTEELAVVNCVEKMLAGKP